MRGSLTSFTRRKSPGPAPPTATGGRELTDEERRLMPVGFEAVGEAVAAGRSPVAACAVLGRHLASDGASLGEALSGLAATCAAVGGAEPDFSATEALSVAWSEATLEFLHEVSCEDPLTGLATLPHLRSRLSEVYRDAQQRGTSVRSTRALVVVDVRPASRRMRPEAREAPFVRALRMAAVAQVFRAVFGGGETVTRVGPDRAVALVRRTPEIGDRIRLVRERVLGLDLVSDARVWVEGLPADGRLAVRVLSELTR